MRMSKAKVLEALDEIRAAIVADDSFEGSIAYSAMEPDLEPGEFEVVGSYRVGNSEGQGGVRIIPATDPVA